LCKVDLARPLLTTTPEAKEATVGWQRVAA